MFSYNGDATFCLCLQNGQLVGSVTDVNNNVSSLTGPALPLNTWTHVALVGSAGTLTLYANGQNVGSTARGAAQYTSDLPLAIGADSQGQGIFNGNIDEVRITNGIARYTGNFNPTAPYPNSGSNGSNSNGNNSGNGNSNTPTLTLAAGQQSAIAVSGTAGGLLSLQVANVATTPSGGTVTFSIANPDGSVPVENGMRSRCYAKAAVDAAACRARKKCK